MTLIKSKSSQLLAALSLIAILSSCQNLIKSKTSGDTSASSDPSKAIISTYKGGQVTLKDATQELSKLIAKNDKLKGITFDNLNSDQKETVIKEVVISQIASAEAKKRKLDKDKDYQEALKNFESELLKQKLLLALAKDASDEAIVKKNYDELAATLKNKKDFRISYIAVKTENEAGAIYRLLAKLPNTFASQARKKSIDLEVAKKGGDLGFVTEDMLPADVLQQTKTLQKGRISKPFFTNGKWVIIRLDGERPAEILPFEKTKDAVAQNLVKKAIEEFVSQSMEKAKINFLVK